MKVKRTLLNKAVTRLAKLPSDGKITLDFDPIDRRITLSVGMDSGMTGSITIPVESTLGLIHLRAESDLQPLKSFLQSHKGSDISFHLEGASIEGLSIDGVSAIVLYIGSVMSESCPKFRVETHPLLHHQKQQLTGDEDSKIYLQKSNVFLTSLARCIDLAKFGQGDIPISLSWLTKKDDDPTIKPPTWVMTATDRKMLVVESNNLGDIRDRRFSSEEKCYSVIISPKDAKSIVDFAKVKAKGKSGMSIALRVGGQGLSMSFSEYNNDLYRHQKVSAWLAIPGRHEEKTSPVVRGVGLLKTISCTEKYVLPENDSKVLSLSQEFDFDFSILSDLLNIEFNKLIARDDEFHLRIGSRFCISPREIAAWELQVALVTKSKGENYEVVDKIGAIYAYESGDSTTKSFKQRLKNPLELTGVTGDWHKKETHFYDPSQHDGLAISFGLYEQRKKSPYWRVLSGLDSRVQLRTDGKALLIKTQTSWVLWMPRVITNF